ncbi:MAG: ABC transporter ATP-binding protein [bacterium]|nr:ABC transporter ATP-binding protein [bacterium]
MLLKLERVAKAYGGPSSDRSVRVLEAIDLEIEAGESVAIVGPSGSGKSTLLHIMGGLDGPSSGAVFLNDRNIVGMQEKELAAVRNTEVGFVFQMHHLLPQCTVLENCLLPTLAASAPSDGEESVQRALRLLARVGLTERVHHRPGQLSGGECQRAAVVRALVNRPSLVLADEPTGSLDRASAEQLTELLAELNREEDVTVVVVTHSMELAQRMGRVLCFDGNELRPYSGTSAAA